MKFSCLKENFNKGLQVISRVASKNTSLPILNNILIEAKNEIINLTATDLEVGAQSLIRGKIEEEGRITVPAGLLANYINLLPNKQVNVVLRGNDIEIICEKQKTKIKGIEAADFPIIPKIEKNKCYLINKNELKRAIQQVLLTIMPSETRPEISGALLVFGLKDVSGAKDKLFVVGTDSYRLAEKTIGLKVVAEKDKETMVGGRVIVPHNALQELGRILDSEEEEEVRVYTAENQIMFDVGETELVSRLISGQYPDYKQIIPGNFKVKVGFKISELVAGVRTSSLFSQSGINDISLNFRAKPGVVEVSSVNSQTGENKSEIDANVSIELEEQEIGIVFNYRYLLDGLNALGGDDGVFQMIDNNSPAMLRLAENDDYMYILMPIRQ